MKVTLHIAHEHVEHLVSRALMRLVRQSRLGLLLLRAVPHEMALIATGMTSHVGRIW